MIDFLRFLLGYVRFNIIGDFPERLLNQLVSNGVSVWGITRNKNGVLANISIRNYLKIRQYRGKNRVKTKISERKGLPFFLKKHQLRIGFFIGPIVFFAILLLLSSFIWNVRVVGNEALTTAEIIAVCEDLGLKEGVRISKLDTEKLRTELALRLDKISWASINIEGVRATVNISESLDSKKDPEKPCNLIADRDGVITAIEVTDGTIKTKLGQTVKKGDLLVSGIIEYKDGTYRFSKSAGKVFAETERELTCFVPFENQKVVRTGDIISRQVLSFFGLKIPLYLGTVKGSYETESEISLFNKNDMYLPVSITETKFYKTQSVSYTLTESQAKEVAREKLENIKNTELKEVEILSETAEILAQNNGITINAKFKCRENIAIKDLLLILPQ